MRSLYIEHLYIRRFRNLASIDVIPSPRLNVLFGDNGQGKTNTLEAIYLLATSRSFRTHRTREVIEHGHDAAVVRAALREGTHAREQKVTLSGAGRAAFFGDKRAENFANYAVKAPVVVFHPADLELTMGPSQGRRKLLDRLLVYSDPSLAECLVSYRRALAARQHILAAKGPTAKELAEWEILLARYGIAIALARATMASRLAQAARPALARIAPDENQPSFVYTMTAAASTDAYLDALHASRPVDVRRRGASIGPHRDDLDISRDNRPLRGVASQGQHRSLVLALKAAELQIIGEVTSASPILLLDDVSSELDAKRSRAMLQFFANHTGQTFITTTRPELIETPWANGPDDRIDFELHEGELKPAPC